MPLTINLNNVQPLDTDLTAIAGLSPSNDDFIQRKSGAWTNRTMAQLAADLTASNITGYLGFTLMGGWAAGNPIDATTYYANSIATALNVGSANIQAFHIPKDCTLKRAYVNVICGAASGEAVTYNVYIGGVATLIATDTSTTTNFTVSNTSMSLACTAGQTVLLQIVTPTWATNPSTHRGSYTLYFE